ncbi:hypothetical protein LXL04_014525 [Taraxacum kok-saghyz]
MPSHLTLPFIFHSTLDALRRMAQLPVDALRQMASCEIIHKHLATPPKLSAAMTGHRQILIVAYAGQGHVNPAIRFANRLIKKDVDVTLCTSISVVQRIDKKTIPPGLTFAPFSDGHDSGKQPTTPLEQYVSDFDTNGARAVAEIISSAVARGQPFDHLIYTTVIPWAARVADAHGIKSTLLWCQPATVLAIYYYYFNGYQGFNDIPINLPGLPLLTSADLPSFLLPSNPKEYDFLVQMMKDHVDVLKLGRRILVNSFSELEVESFRAIEKIEYLPIGPLIPSEYLDGENSSDNSLGEDFFDKSEDDYIQWLNTKPKSSVVYVSFGTIASFSVDQMEEIATGLLEIGRPFLWVIRDSEQAGRLSKIEELKKHGMIVSWCSQVVVLSHQAIGCFVMHCGWNSTMETVVAGVPAVVFPQWSDQGTNAKIIEDVCRTGVRVRRREGDGVVEGKEIKRCVKMAMEDEDMKKNAVKWRKLAREALNNCGSSTLNLMAFLDEYFTASFFSYQIKGILNTRSSGRPMLKFKDNNDDPFNAKESDLESKDFFIPKLTDAIQHGIGMSFEEYEMNKLKYDQGINRERERERVSRSFENSYIPENPRTPKPLTFSKNRLRGAKNRSNLRLVAKKKFRKNNFFFFKKFAYVQKKICAYVHVLRFCFKNAQIPETFLSLYTTYLKGLVKKNFKKNAKKKNCIYAKIKKKSCLYAKVEKKYRFFGNFFQRILFILNVLEGSEVGFLKGITVWEI